jgi:hypothetical protein
MPRRDKNDPEFLDMLGAEIHEFPDVTVGSSQIADKDAIQDLITGMITEAVEHYTQNLEPDQVKATDYYYGRTFGNEEEGRSKVVSTDVKDATKSQMPNLMKIFMGADNVVEFKPQNEGKVEAAMQQTDYVNMIVREDNPGYLIFQNAFKDALVRRVGYFKWWWEDYDRVRGYNYTNLSEQGLQMLMQDEDVDDVEVLSQSTDEDGLPVFDVIAKRFESDGRARFEAVPPEEIVWTPDARDFESAGLVAHTREVTVDDASRITGLPYDELEEFIGEHERTGSENLGWARQYHGGSSGTATLGASDDSKPLSQRPVLLTEAYAMMDLDNDDVAELRMFHCLGPMYEIVNGENGDGEIVNELPFSYITPDPEPHTIPGMSNYDDMKDIQEVKSQVRRGMLNSLARSIDPPTEVVSTDVNMKDLLNPEISNIIRVRRPGMMREISHTFIGAETMAVEEHFNEIRADRGGITRASEGLDPNSLQSSTKEAVAGTLSKAQQRVESIARAFAETGVKRLYQGLLGLVIEHQDRPRNVELRGKFVDVNPAVWDLATEVRVNPALGTGSLDEKVVALSNVIADQQALMQSGAPFVSNVEARNARRRLMELSGFTNISEFYKEWTVEAEQQMQQQIAEQEPPPDPAMELVKIEQLKAQLRAIEVQRKIELEQQKAAWKDDYDRDKLARETALKEAEIEAEFAVRVEDAILKAKIQQDRVAQSVNESE